SLPDGAGNQVSARGYGRERRKNIGRNRGRRLGVACFAVRFSGDVALDADDPVADLHIAADEAAAGEATFCVTEAEGHRAGTGSIKAEGPNRKDRNGGCARMEYGIGETASPGITAAEAASLISGPACR